MWRSTHEGREILVKIYDVHVKQARDSAREWSMATILAESGLPVAPPLFMATHEDGRVAVASTFILDATTVQSIIANERCEVSVECLTQLFRCLAAQHNANTYQKDNHLGNYLWHKGDIIMLDAATCIRQSKPLSAATRIQNLAQLIAALPLSLQWAPKVALQAYEEACVQKIDPQTCHRAIQQARRQRRRRYVKKTQRECTEFEHRIIGRKHWHACRDLDAALTQQLINNPDAFFQARPLLKDGNTCTVVEIQQGTRSYILKRYNKKPFRYRVAHRLTKPRALRSWSHGHALRLFGIPTPRPMACLLVHHGQLLEKSYLLMEKIEGDSLHCYGFPRNTLPAIAQEFAKRQDELGLLQCSHGDTKASNYIISPDGRLHLIDLDSLTFHRSTAVFLRRARKDQVRFLNNWRNFPEYKAAFQAAL